MRLIVSPAEKGNFHMIPSEDLGRLIDVCIFRVNILLNVMIYLVNVHLRHPRICINDSYENIFSADRQFLEVSCL